MATENNFGKASLKGISPHHLSFQNFILLPLAILKQILQFKASQPLLIVFHTPHTTLPSILQSTNPPLLPHTSLNYLLRKAFPLNRESPTPFSDKSLIKSDQISNSQAPTPLIRTNYRPIHISKSTPTTISL